MPEFRIGETLKTDSPTVDVEVGRESTLPVGSHVFQLVVVDDSGNESLPAQVKVVVRDTRRPTAVLRGPESVEFGRSFALDGSGSSDLPPGRLVSFSWTLLGRT